MTNRPRLAIFLVAALAALGIGARPVAGQAGIVEQVGSVTTDAGAVVIEDVKGGLTHPWGMDFMPGGERLLVTERSGDLNVLNLNTGALSGVGGTPNVFAQGQGGLLDVALAPNFEDNRYVYLSFSEPGPEGSASTALGRGRLSADASRLEDFEVLFSQDPKIVGPNHFGSRIAFSNDGEHLFLTLGERFQFEPAQDLSNSLGAVVRLRPDGTVPEDNPFVGQENAEEAIWSYGHRNIQSAAVHPETGQLWTVEFGPLGGDELNQPEAGKNYGWPVVSWGQDYDGEDIPNPPTHPRFADAPVHCTPVISPSGMAFYTGDQFPAWQGTALIGSLTDQGLVRVATQAGGSAEEVERVPLSARIRSVEQGPEGNVYVLTDQDDGNVWRVRPLEESQAGR
jgi:glucose/arabinose dehydrogenase